jgi:hypothetical protein
VVRGELIAFSSQSCCASLRLFLTVLETGGFPVQSACGWAQCLARVSMYCHLQTTYTPAYGSSAPRK